jgi:phosphonate transport system substrate-binding protein
MGFKRSVFLAFSFITLVAEVGSVRAETKAIRFGSVAMDTPAVMHQRLQPLTNYLSHMLGQPVVLRLSPDMPSAIAEVATGEVDIAFLTPVAYLNSHAQGKTRLIVKMLTDQRPSFKLVIVVRNDSAIVSAKELVGKRFAFGDRAAILQRAVVVAAGIPLERLGSYEFLDHYDNIVRGVLNKDFDAGILTDVEAFRWQDRGVRILYSSADLPPYNMTASSNMDEIMYAKVRAAFLALDINNPEHRPIIEALGKHYTGFAPTDDTEYDVIRKLIKPFQH